MIVIANKTEERLLEDINLSVEENPSQKCFYMEFSKSEIDKDELQETFLSLSERLPNSYMANIYICRDKDIFILMQGFMQSQFAEFIKKLSATLGAPELMDLTRVFELRLHWDRIENICKTKLGALEDTDEDIENQEKDKAIDIYAPLDVQKIKTIVQRRSKRADPLILVVDDDELSRMLVGNVLSPEFNVKFAKDGKTALQQYTEHAPDICFLDIGLPDINGHQLLEVFAQIDPNSYIIMFSGRKNKSNILKALRLGSQGFVGKPFSREKLLHYINKSPFIRKKRGLTSRENITA